MTENAAIGAANTIVLICPKVDKNTGLLSDPLTSEFVTHIGNAIAAKGCDFLIAPHKPGDHDWKANYLDTQKAQGIIVLGQAMFTDAIARLKKEEVPFVVWGAINKNNQYCTVSSDNARGGFIAAKHLLEKGRRNILFLGQTGYAEVKERYVGYRTALKELEIEHDQSLVANLPLQARTRRQMLDKLLDEKCSEIDAVFASTDTIAFDLLSICQEREIPVPEKLSIVGFGDLVPAEHCQPPLTTVKQDVGAASKELVSRLLSLIEGNATKSLRIPVSLVERESTAEKQREEKIVGSVTLNSRGVIEFLDKGAERFLTYSKAELFGKALQYIMPDPELYGDQIPDFNWSEVSKSENLGLPLVLYFEQKDGEIIGTNARFEQHVRNPENFSCKIIVYPEDEVEQEEHYEEGLEETMRMMEEPEPEPEQASASSVKVADAGESKGGNLHVIDDEAQAPSGGGLYVSDEPEQSQGGSGDFFVTDSPEETDGGSDSFFVTHSPDGVEGDAGGFYATDSPEGVGGEEFAEHDPLTGIASRLLFDQAIKEAVAEAHELTQELALLIFDIDLFSAYNALYGDEAGDACIQKVAAIIADIYQDDNSLVARYAGDQIVVVILGVNPQDAFSSAELCLQSLQTEGIPHSTSNVDDCLTLSCGMSSGQPQANTLVKRVLWQAEKALYEAKGDGKNQVKQNRF